jgi:hypothetical protein
MQECLHEWCLRNLPTLTWYGENILLPILQGFRSTPEWQKDEDQESLGRSQRPELSILPVSLVSMDSSNQESNFSLLPGSTC